MKAKNTMVVDDNDAKKVEDLIDALEDLDDVQDVYSNMG